MLSLLQHTVSKLFSYSNTYNNHEGGNDKNETEENVESLLAQIEDIRQNNTEKEEPQLNLIDEEEGCFYKSGIITVVRDDEYVLIEHKYMCEWKYIIPSGLKKGDKVHYLAYKCDKGEELKVRKIVSKFDASWESKDEDNEEETITDIKRESNANLPEESKLNEKEIKVSSSDVILERRRINKVSIVGKVDKRKGREVFLEDETRGVISINLDKISSIFIPVVGDWVKLECLTEINEEIPNLRGEILEVQSMVPLRQINKLGKVTQYSDATESGTIEKHIIFTKDVCMSGYLPRVGDKVVVESIESTQGLHKWRALLVLPLEDVTDRFETSTIKYKPQLPPEEIVELTKDKENITITDNINVSLDVRTEQQIEVSVTNNGNFQQKIYKCSFLNKRSESQLIIMWPVENEPQILKPSDTITYKFKCKAKFVGTSEELIIFKFRQFKIARIIQIKVNSINPTKLDMNGATNGYNTLERNNLVSVIPQHHEEGMYIRGVKPFRSAKFITQRPVTWRIPDILWAAINRIEMERKTRSEAEFIMADRVPVLQEPLSIKNYKQRFDYLLYLEEIAQILEMQRFLMKSVVMHRSGEYLTLTVPGLAEKRPSLIIGDRVIISHKWDETNGEKKYEGFIHKIRSNDVFLKFERNYHEKYQMEDCDVNFRGSTTVIQRCHAAISIVVHRLGEEFLFPKKVIQKDPQYNFIENQNNEDDSEDDDDDDNISILKKLPSVKGVEVTDSKLREIEAILNKRKLKWFNKKLNKYQKEAVRNILKGLARPLPYVIFGPPGTGKTITVCESILQIMFTMSDSRILIATPSNSSANLIAEKLLDSKILKPGDMVRLVAHHYLDSESIPMNLIPYCVTADIAAEGSNPDVNMLDSRGCKTNVTLSVLCHHRIIVGTCSALGILYNMGCKPGHFTHIIIDEAGQASEPEVMIPLSLAHSSSTQVILAGDPKQLGPINQSRLAGYFGLNDSFLVRLLQQFPYQEDKEGFPETGRDPRLVTKLLMNYRSLPDLLALPNKLFYQSELIPQVHEEHSEEAKLLNSLADMLPKRMGGPPAIIFHCVNGTNKQDEDSPSWYNLEEATQVYIYLLDLYNHGLKPDDIGIITPYSKQVYRIRALLAEFDTDIPKVGSVEEFQGQERKVIILSTVRTSADKVREDIKHSLGFVSSRERLNVAITRARTLLIIIGNPTLLQQDVYWRSVIEHCNLRKSLVNNK